MIRLGIVISHPIQYYAPLFKYLATEIDLTVFYGHKPAAMEQGKSGFGISFKWDVDLLSGYKHIFLPNSGSVGKFGRFGGVSTPDIGKYIRSEGCTHILIMGWQYKLYWQSFIYCRIHKIPIAVRGDSHLGTQRSFFKRALKRIFYPLFLNQFTRIFYVGSGNREYLLHYGVSKNKLLFSPHSVDQDYWGYEKGNPINGVFTFIWVAKFIPLKRPKDVLEAFIKVSSDLNMRTRLLMIGDGELFEECSKNYRHDGINFLGFRNQSELRKHYAESDCLILSSDSETWGLVVNEAFAYEIPAIVSDACGCVPDMINEQTGITYPFGDVNALANNMSTMVKNLMVKKSFYREGIRKINDRYNFQTNLWAFKEFLQS